MRYFEFEIELLDIEPRIWRRFLLRSDDCFAALHEAIQDAGPWDYGHMFEFRTKARRGEAIAGMVTGGFDDGETPDADETPLADYFKRANKKCIYIYDFGDDWHVQVTLKRTQELPEDFTRRLLGGERAFPLEDSGGVWGYYRCLAAVGKADPSDFNAEDLDCTREWIPEDWDPEAFDLEKRRKKFNRLRRV